MCTENQTKEMQRIKHNVVVLVGNGFDIQVLSEFSKNGIISSYEKFYDFLCYKNFNKENLLFQKMKENKQKNVVYWSDFEHSLNDLLSQKQGVSLLTLDKDLFDLQTYFSMFLNELVTPELLKNFGEQSSEKQWAVNTMSKFLNDLDEENYNRIVFPDKTDHFHEYNFTFFNFNYTPLLDNYIYLDKKQFDPHKYKTVDRNFKFYPDARCYKMGRKNNPTIWSSYIMQEIIHPHGRQDIPRSMLFGIDLEEYKQTDERKKFVKSYWAQNDSKYKKYFEDADLFIIYGSSMGETDMWWWRQIFQSLLDAESELIIYNYCSDEMKDKESIKDIFIKRGKDTKKAYLDFAKIKEKIFIVNYNNKTKNIFLDTKVN